jgi:hypothetical protein
MFKKAADLTTYKKYLKVLRTALKRLKKLQSARNAGDHPDGGPQTNDVMQSVRYFGDYTFDDKNDKKPHALLLVGKKAVVNKIAEELISKSKSGSKAGKPLAAGAKGFVYWHENDETFNFLCKGPMKLPELKKLLKLAGFHDQAVLGFATEETEKKAEASEQETEQLDAGLGEEVEGAEDELPDLDAAEQAKPGAPETTGQGETPADGLAVWQAAREDAIGQLRRAAAAIAANKNDYARAAILEIQSIIKNLTPRPDTPQAVAELESYLRYDDVVNDAEQLPSSVATLKIREPLLAALGALKK